MKIYDVEATKKFDEALHHWVIEQQDLARYGPKSCAVGEAQTRP